MNSDQEHIARNTSWFTAALVLQKIISFAYFTYLARVLGAENLGQYIFALSFVQIFSIVIDFGISHYITREVAKHPERTQHIYANTLGFKLFSGASAVALTVFFVHLLGYPLLTRQLVYVTSVLMVVESLILSSYAVIRGHHNLRFESLATVGTHAFLALLGVIALQVTRDLRLLLGVLVVSYTLNLLYVIWLLKKRFHVRFRFSFDVQFWRRAFLVVVPFALAGAFTRIYGAFDQVLLSKLASSTALGYYGVAYKMTFALQFLPLALVAALYPAMSAYYVKDKQMLHRAFTRAVYYLIIITIPLSAGVVTLARPFIRTLYTEAYFPSVVPLQILIASLPFLFVNFPIGSLLNAADRQKRQTLNIALALLVNVVLNIALIPRFEAAGAAFASLVSTVFLFFIGWQAIKGVARIDGRFLLLVSAKTVFAGAALAFAALLFLDFGWLFSALAGFVVYAVIQLALRTITRRDIEQFVFSFRRSEKN